MAIPLMTESPKNFLRFSITRWPLPFKKLNKQRNHVSWLKHDIKSTFRIIPIHPSDHELLGFEWEGQLYHDWCLPMGCSASCNIFETFSTALQWAALRGCTNVEMLHVLDDFLFISPNRKDCQKGLKHFCICVIT